MQYLLCFAKYASLCYFNIILNIPKKFYIAYEIIKKIKGLKD